MKVRKTPKAQRPRLPVKSLDQLHYDLVIVSQKLLGLASLFDRVATDEFGTLDLDEKAIGIGEIIKGFSNEVGSIASTISEHALIEGRVSHSKS